MLDCFLADVLVARFVRGDLDGRTRSGEAPGSRKISSSPEVDIRSGQCSDWCAFVPPLSDVKCSDFNRSPKEY